MPTKKILNKKPPCLSPEHEPPKHMAYSPGTYEYECPQCGEKITFVVEGFYL